MQINHLVILAEMARSLVDHLILANEKITFISHINWS